MLIFHVHIKALQLSSYKNVYFVQILNANKQKMYIQQSLQFA